MTYYANHPTTDNTRRSITKGEEKPHFLTILSNMTKRRKGLFRWKVVRR
jgi:hypothetical protein